MFKYVINRIMAYVLDTLVISFIVLSLSQIKLLNPYQKQYAEVYKQYTEVSKQYNNKKITAKEYNKESVVYNYQLAKYNVSYSVLSIVITFSYFGLLQYALKGKTFGKMLFKLQTVSNDDRKLKIGNYAFRSVIINGIIISLINIACLYLFKSKGYYNTVLITEILDGVIIYASLGMIIFRPDRRGIHDILSNTKVIRIDEKEEQVIEKSSNVKTAKVKQTKIIKKVK